MRGTPEIDEQPHPQVSGARRAILRVGRRLRSPFERFLSIEAAGGVLLLAASLGALAWANSPWRSTYESLLGAPVGIRVGAWHLEHDLRFWINDALMALFFFVVGLEIKRELQVGELRDARRAALPALAALGGMLVPAGIYVLFNHGTPAAKGWGIPMATDIAFAVGAFAVLGRRIPRSLRTLLLALAVIDDLGSVLVIAVFYSSGIGVVGLLTALAGVAVILVMQRLRVRSPWSYLPAALVTWAGTYLSGVHPAIAGVVVGLLTPMRPSWDLDGSAGHPEAGDEVVSPGERLESALHGWVAFAIMPIFAFANAGIRLGSASLEGAGTRVLLGIVLGLVVGKPIGVVVFSWLGVRARLAVLPTGVSWRGVFAVGLVAAIGFTMSLFIATLAFPSGNFVGAAKLGILVASASGTIIGLGAGRLILRPPVVSGGAGGPTPTGENGGTAPPKGA